MSARFAWLSSGALCSIGAMVWTIAGEGTAQPPDVRRAALVSGATLELPPGVERAACGFAMSRVTLDDSRQAFCIDRYEASIERRSADGQWRRWPGNHTVDGIEAEIRAAVTPGYKPQGYINANQAAVACQRSGKRLCTSKEWIRACRGSADTRYPYGNERRAGVCNDRFKGISRHPVVRVFAELAPAGTNPQQMWSKEWLNHPRLHELDGTVAAAGSYLECTNDTHTFDMVGNLHEWVADKGGTFRGGYFMDTYQHGEGCEYRTTAHSRKYHDYSTGFRCCSDVEEAD